MPRVKRHFEQKRITLYTAAASADDQDAPIFSFSRFGTVDVVHSSEKTDYVSSVFRPSGAGYTSDWSADVDRLVGA